MAKRDDTSIADVIAWTDQSVQVLFSDDILIISIMDKGLGDAVDVWMVKTDKRRFEMTSCLNAYLWKCLVVDNECDQEENDDKKKRSCTLFEPASSPVPVHFKQKLQKEDQPCL